MAPAGAFASFVCTFAPSHLKNTSIPRKREQRHGQCPPAAACLTEARPKKGRGNSGRDRLSPPKRRTPTPKKHTPVYSRGTLGKKICGNEVDWDSVTAGCDEAWHTVLWCTQVSHAAYPERLSASDFHRITVFVGPLVLGVGRKTSSPWEATGTTACPPRLPIHMHTRRLIQLHESSDSVLHPRQPIVHQMQRLEC